MAVIAAIQMA